MCDELFILGKQLKTIMGDTCKVFYQIFLLIAFFESQEISLQTSTSSKFLLWFFLIYDNSPTHCDNSFTTNYYSPQAKLYPILLPVPFFPPRDKKNI